MDISMLWWPLPLHLIPYTEFREAELNKDVYTTPILATKPSRKVCTIFLDGSWGPLTSDFTFCPLSARSLLCSGFIDLLAVPQSRSTFPFPRDLDFLFSHSSIFFIPLTAGHKFSLHGSLPIIVLTKRLFVPHFVPPTSPALRHGTYQLLAFYSDLFHLTDASQGWFLLCLEWIMAHDMLSK